jgi:hypothetical protein
MGTKNAAIAHAIVLLEPVAKLAPGKPRKKSRA